MTFYTKSLMVFFAILLGMIALIAGGTIVLMWWIDPQGHLEGHWKSLFTFVICGTLSFIAAYHMTGPMKELLRRGPGMRKVEEARKSLKRASKDNSDPLFPWLPKQ